MDADSMHVFRTFVALDNFALDGSADFKISTVSKWLKIGRNYFGQFYLQSNIWQDPKKVWVFVESFEQDVDVLLHVLLQLLGVHGDDEAADVAENLKRG